MIILFKVFSIIKINVGLKTTNKIISRPFIVTNCKTINISYNKIYLNFLMHPLVSHVNL